MLDFMVLAQECAPTVAPQTMAAVVQVESSFNPFAIGIVGGRLQRQPETKEEAIATAESLEAEDWNFSIGIAQINRYNLPKYDLTYEQAFDPCENMRVGSKILEDCYTRALARVEGDEQQALQSAFSCYYSGNFTRGFQPDREGDPSYVEKVLAQADVAPQAIPVVPSIRSGEPRPQRVTAAPSATAPVRLSAQRAVPAGPPADHAPVLLQRAAGTAEAQAVMTATPPVADLPVTSEEGKDEQPKRSAVVF